MRAGLLLGRLQGGAARLEGPDDVQQVAEAACQPSDTSQAQSISLAQDLQHRPQLLSAFRGRATALLSRDDVAPGGAQCLLAANLFLRCRYWHVG